MATQNLMSHLMDVFKKSGLCERNDYEVFKTIIEVAEQLGKTPYEVDKRNMVGLPQGTSIMIRRKSLVRRRN